MPKQETVSYKANFKDEVDEKTKEVTREAFSYDGTVVYNFPESTEEAVQMFGEKPTLSAFCDALKIKVQALCRRHETQDEAQEAANGYVPGVSARGTGPTNKQVKEVLSKMTKEQVEELLAGL
jgi:hypothetical protein